MQEVLADSPVALLQGPRQCGKTTLAQTFGESAGYRYITFDDAATHDFAKADPVRFVRDLPDRVILDEVQRVPWLFSSIKLLVDGDRRPGRFILTGSVNVLQVREITDSLAGRMEIVRLHPFSQAELSRTPSGFLGALFSGGFKHGQYERLPDDAAGTVAAGGYPPALAIGTERRRAAWYLNYVAALVQRDVPDISNVRDPETLSQLLEVASAHTAQLLNVNNLASSFRASRLTIDEYLHLLERMFLLKRLPAWHNSRMKRLVKAPKLHLGDTGLACALLDAKMKTLTKDRALFGHMLETFVLQELQRQADADAEKHSFFHYREKDGAEVDIVIQRGTALAGVEVKASATISNSDFYGLRRFRSKAGERFAGGVVVYNGEKSGSFGDGLYAVPLRLLWETA